MIYLWIILLVAGIDQGVKWLIVSNMQPYQSTVLVKGILWLTYVCNHGAAFNFLDSHRLLLLAITLAVFGLVWVLRKQIARYPFITKFGLAIALGGALGNFIDRARLGYVVDYLDFRVWPVFNIADMAILGGVILISLGLLRQDSQRETHEKAEVTRGSGGDSSLISKEEHS